MQILILGTYQRKFRTPVLQENTRNSGEHVILKSDPNRPRFQYMSRNCPKMSSRFLRLHKKLQKYWNIVCSIWKPRIKAFKYWWENVDTFISFPVIIKKTCRHIACLMHIRPNGSPYNDTIFKITQNVTKVTTSSLCHLKALILDFQMLQTRFQYLCYFL